MKSIYNLVFSCTTIALGLLVSCQVNHSKEKSENHNRMEETETAPLPTPNNPDVHSFAKPEEAVVEHLSLNLEVNFEKKQLSGRAKWKIKANPSSSLFLDTKQLTIQKITDGEGNPLSFTLHESIEYLGSALEISLTKSTQEVIIDYQTSPEADAIQWLSPAQTEGKKYPFMFTQSQAILARSWVPCQDSPGIRFTYDAQIKVPNHLLALMSAENPQQRNDSGIYQFSMPQPIPSYLLALAVGDLQFKSLGERTGVYAAPSMLKKSAYELTETEKMLEAAEELYGEYRWGRYDVLMMPASFPFGGMENPRLTFATPTILAGDRSLVSLVAHELAHSWSGNLVTNATWNDFWLNEGFTVYFEMRIMEKLYGKSFAEMLALISYQDLQETIKRFDYNEDTQLKLNLEGRSPDDGMSSIAYDKGYLFLRLIEEKVGRNWWDKFLNQYFEEHAFQAMNTETFLSYLDEQLLYKYNTVKDEINIDKWVYGVGLPENAPKIHSERFEAVAEYANNFLENNQLNTKPTDEWTYQEWVYFLRQLPNKLTNTQMAKLDNTFAFSSSGNSEILFEWFIKAIESEYQPAYYPLEKFLLTVGRRKFIAPLYEKMLAQESLSAHARSIYKKARSNYHYVSTSTIDKLMDASLAIQ